MPSHRHTLGPVLGALCAALLLWPYVAAAGDERPELTQLRAEFEATAERVFDRASPQAPDTLPGRIAQLRASVQRTPTDERQRLELAAAELEFGMHRAAAQRLDRVLAQGDPLVYDEALCLRAQLELARGDTRGSFDLLQQARLDQLGARYDECALLKGIVLQKTGRYRESIEVMDTIPANSPRYAAAQFNIALAEIRNGWWSDGETRIARLAAETPETAEVERSMVDRFYTTMGYSRLERDYYRQARSAFRQVRRDGPYTDRALLGLALAALQQRRYHQALELARLLAASETQSLPVEEAHLVIPYTLDRMRQDEQARVAYEQSIAYFQGRITTLEAGGTRAAVARDRLHYDLDPEGHGALHALIDQIDALDRLLGNSQPSLRRDLAGLRARAVAVQQTLLLHAIRERQEQLHSYLSQARYGLAHLLDRASSQQVEP